MTTTDLFDKETLDRLLHKFLQELSDSGVKGTVKLVGAAALSLYYFDRDSTRDIDAGLPSDPRVKKAILKIAKDEGLKENWINSDAILHFGFPPMDFWDERERIGNVVLQVASPKLLLAMKLRASRGRRDFEDVQELLRLTEIKSLEEVDLLFEEVYAQDALKPQAHEFLLEYFEEKDSPKLFG